MEVVNFCEFVVNDYVYEIVCEEIELCLGVVMVVDCFVEVVGDEYILM